MLIKQKNTRDLFVVVRVWVKVGVTIMKIH